MNNLSRYFIFCVLASIVGASAEAATSRTLTKDDIIYVGAFRFKPLTNEYGATDRARGGLALSSDGESLFLVGKIDRLRNMKFQKLFTPGISMNSKPPRQPRNPLR